MKTRNESFTVSLSAFDTITAVITELDYHQSAVLCRKETTLPRLIFNQSDVAIVTKETSKLDASSPFSFSFLRILVYVEILSTF